MHAAPEGFDAIDSPYRSTAHVDVVVFPSFLDISRCVAAHLSTGGQCGRFEAAGAFTGDVSMQMLKKAGCTHVLCGHSEHRRYHHESDEEVIRQVVAASEAGLMPILCIGESAEEHANGMTRAVVERQLRPLSAHTISSLIVAYEPVWAIGAGKTPEPQDIDAIHACIRSMIASGPSLRVIYGGSMNASNASTLLALPHVDGGLVGGASLKTEDFRKIVEAGDR